MKGFVKSLEVLFALLLLLSFYSLTLPKTYTEEKPNLLVFHNLVNSLYKSGIFQTYLENYKIYELRNLIKELLPPGYFCSVDVDYLVNLKFNSTGLFYFSYNLPSCTKRISLYPYQKIYYYYDWYYNKIFFYSDNYYRDVLILVENLTLYTPFNFSQEKILPILNNKKIDYEIYFWNKTGNYTEVSFIFYLPYIEPNEYTIYLYYTTNSSPFYNTPKNLTGDFVSLPYSILSSNLSNRVDIFINITTPKEYVLKMEMGEPNKTFTEPNFSNIIKYDLYDYKQKECNFKEIEIPVGAKALTIFTKIAALPDMIANVKINVWQVI